MHSMITRSKSRNPKFLQLQKKIDKKLKNEQEKEIYNDIIILLKKTMIDIENINIYFNNL